ncbi:MAG: FliM/FliN family flagellar motor switch protein [Candidatus Midichloria sp.]|nr:MAG: FliM/FliN family flagellar motor switch protein [Candidatus Midichloria sp.]
MQDNEIGKENNKNTATLEINLQAVYDIPLQVRVLLRSTDLKLNKILKLSKGAVAELDKKVGDPVDLFIGDR